MPTISNAIADDVAGWALDEITLFNIRARKIDLIGVREIDTGAVYLTKLAYFFDMSKGKIHDYQGIGGGSRQRCLSLSFFAQRKGSVRVRKGVLEGNQDKSLLSNAYQELIEEIPA